MFGWLVGFAVFSLFCFVFIQKEKWRREGGGGGDLLSTILFHLADCRIYGVEKGNQAFIREYNAGLKYLRYSEVTEKQFMKPEIVFYFGRICFTLLYYC